MLSQPDDFGTLPLLGLASLATLAGLLVAVVARRRAAQSGVVDALAAGVLLGLLANLLLRLSVAAGVAVNLLTRLAPSASWRAPLATGGPYAIQLLAVAVLLVAYAFSMQAGRPASPDAKTPPAHLVLLSLGVCVYEFVHGLTAPAAAGEPAASAMLSLVGGLVLVQASRGLAVGGVMLAQNAGGAWMPLAALAIGPPGLIGVSVGRRLSFETLNALAVPLLVLAAVALVLLLARLLVRAREPAARGPLQVGGFLVGLLAALGALGLFEAGVRFA